LPKERVRLALEALVADRWVIGAPGVSGARFKLSERGQDGLKAPRTANVADSEL
jgi:hypothetical protein